MKDFTSQILENWKRSAFHHIDPVYPIKFILTNPGTNKLRLLKAIKEITGLGLKDSKDLIDDSSIAPVMFISNLTLSQLDKFKEDLRMCDNIQFEIYDSNKIRNKKLISLGIYDTQDLIEEIVDMDIDSLFKDEFDTIKLRELLYNIYSKIDKEQLKEIYEGTL